MIIPLINAFSVSYPYTKDNPFVISPGQTGEFEIELQSSSSDKTENIKIEVLEGGDIISLENSLLEVKAQAIVPVKIKASIPQGTPDLTEHKVLMKFSAVSSTENQGTLTFDKSYTIGFNVLVKSSENPAIFEPRISKNTIWLVLIIIILLAIVAGIYFYFKQKKTGLKRK